MLVKDMKNGLLVNAVIDFVNFLRDENEFNYKFVSENQEIFYTDGCKAIMNLQLNKEKYKNNKSQNFLFSFSRILKDMNEDDELKKELSEFILEYLKETNNYNEEMKGYIVNSYVTLDVLTETVDVDKERATLLKEFSDEIRKIEPSFRLALDWDSYFKECQKMEETGVWE